MKISLHKETEIAIGTIVLWMALNIVSDAIWDNKYVTHIQVLAGACVIIGVFILGSIFFNVDKKQGVVISADTKMFDH